MCSWGAYNDSTCWEQALQNQTPACLQLWVSPCAGSRGQRCPRGWHRHCGYGGWQGHWPASCTARGACRCSLAASAVSLPRGVAMAPGRHRDRVWRAAGGAGTGLGARIAAPPERHLLLAPAAGSHAGAKTQLGMETLKGSCPGMQRLLLTPNYLLAQTSWPGLFSHSCCADKVMSAPALLGRVAFPLAEQREEAGKAA